jgi:hypothetical protein
MIKERNNTSEITFTDNISTKSRRDFIKVISVLFAGTAVPVNAAAGLISDDLKAKSVKDYFSLNKIYSTVESLSLADIKHTEGNSFEARYSIFSLAYDLCRKEGDLDIKWATQNDTKICECLVGRDAQRTGLKSYYYQKSYHNSDKLNTPVEWTWKTKIAKDFEADAFQYTEMEGGGAINGKKLKVSRGEKIIIKNLEDTPLLKWAHWPLLMEMKDDESFHFDWIDEMEQIFTGHQLKYRGEALISTRNGKLPLRAFQQTGTGKIPTVYWMYNNVLLFVISGTEVYILDEFNGKHIGCEISVGKIKREIKREKKRAKK